MIEPIIAWWVILIIFIVNGVLLLSQLLDDKNYKTLAVATTFYLFIFYCLYVIRGELL
jgi:hypothetical protein